MRLASALSIFGSASLALAGVLMTLLYVGVYFIADCGPECVARGERTLVLGLAGVGFALAVLGAWLTRRALKRRG